MLCFNFFVIIIVVEKCKKKLVRDMEGGWCEESKEFGEGGLMRKWCGSFLENLN